MQYWYYGHDDGAAINNALQNAPAGADVILPANCGSTVQINLPDTVPGQPTVGLQQSVALRGLSSTSSGIYAFAAPGVQPMKHLIYKGTHGTDGGGLYNMVVEGLGIPQGYGQGYVAPPGATTQNGSIVEIDGGERMHFNDVWMRDGFGSGNAIFQFAPVDADPDNSSQIYKNNPGDIWVLDSRAETPNPLSGAYAPDYDLDLSGSHDSYFVNDNAFNATVANIKIDKGHLLSPHIFSNNAPAYDKNYPPSVAPSDYQQTYPGYPSVLGYPGVATWGVWITGNALVQDVQCDVASHACIYENGRSYYGAPTNIYGLKMDCGQANNVSGSYFGVELVDRARNINLSGVAGQLVCNIPAAQLIHLDGSIDSSVQIFGNTASQVAQLNVPALFAPEGRLSLISGQAVMISDASAATSVYYVPYTGSKVPLYNGLNFMPQDIGAQLALSLSNTAVLAGNLYDVFAGIGTDGVFRLCTGPAWSTSAVRGSSIALTQLGGVWVNQASISCSYSVAGTTSAITCAPNQCTYLGSMLATAAGATSAQFMPLAASGGPAGGATIGIWNAYNRVRATIRVKDSSPPWNAATAVTWEPGHAGFGSPNLGNRVTFVDGLQQSPIHGEVQENLKGNGTNSAAIGLDIDAITGAPDTSCQQFNAAYAGESCPGYGAPMLGLHFLQAMENGATSGAPFGSGLVTILDWEY